MASKKTKPTAKPHSSLPSFALKLKSARILAGFVSAKEIASALDLEVETYRRYERAETDPNLATLLKIRKLTNQSLDVLISGQDVIPILGTAPSIKTRRTRE